MPTIEAKVNVEDVMDMLDIVDLPTSCRYRPADDIRMDVEVSQSEIDDHATEEDPEYLQMDSKQVAALRDGLKSLVSGDYPMASILILRALEGQDDAQLVVEEEIRVAMNNARRAV